MLPGTLFVGIGWIIPFLDEVSSSMPLATLQLLPIQSLLTSNIEKFVDNSTLLWIKEDLGVDYYFWIITF